MSRLLQDPFICSTVSEMTKRNFSTVKESLKFSNHYAHMGLMPIFILRGAEKVAWTEKKRETGSNLRKATSRTISKSLMFKL